MNSLEQEFQIEKAKRLSKLYVEYSHSSATVVHIDRKVMSRYNIKYPNLKRKIIDEKENLGYYLAHESLMVGPRLFFEKDTPS